MPKRREEAAKKAKDAHLFSLVPATQGAAAAVGELFFMEKNFLKEKHIGSSSEVK
jgi:hypothetical protein